MPRKAPPECILILQDVGKNMSELCSSGDECLKVSKDCSMQIMLRRLFTESADEFALITFGGEITKNKLASENEYRGIEEKTEHFAVVNPEVLKQVENLKVNPNGVGDWLDAIVVAIQFIADESEMKAYSALKIVLFSNFHNSVNDDQLDIITKKLKEMEIDFTVIGPDVSANILSGELSSKTKRGEVLISRMVDEIQGTSCSFRDAFTELENLQKRKAKPTPWNSMLHISSKIKVPIRAFKKIAQPKAFKWTLGTIDDETAAVEKEKTYVKFDESNEKQVEVEREELIDAYLFGSTIVPFSDIDKDSMTYKSGPKGLYLVGCTHKSTIPQTILMGEGTYIVMARQDDTVGNHTLQTLIQAMHEKEWVGIARRVYTDNSAAYLGALMPYISDDSRYFVYAQLPFAEDEHVYRFPSLDSTPITDDELKVVDNLINSMDLDLIDPDDEMYDVTRTYDPHEQYTLRCFGHKYVHPNADIPEELKADIIRAMQPKPIVVERSKAALREVKEKFPLQKVIKKAKGRFNKNSDADPLPGIQISGGTLFQKPGVSSDTGTNGASSTSSSSDYQSMQLSVEDLLSTQPEKLDNFVDSLRALRRKCAIENADVYNDWIPQIKNKIEKDNLVKFWDVIVDEKLGLISKSEAASSRVDDKAVEEFLAAKIDAKNEEVDSLYGSIDTESNNDNWLDDL